jgi:hypothetical protein
MVDFLFNGAVVRVPLDRTRPIAELFPEIAQALGIQGDFAVFSDGHTLNKEMALTNDQRSLPDLVIQLAPPPEALSTFQGGGASWIRQCSPLKMAQLSAVEEDCARRVS